MLINIFQYISKYIYTFTKKIIMAPIDTKNKKAKKTVKKKEYNFDLKTKLADGKPWKYLTAFDNDVALKILEAVESNPNGGEYIKVINNTMRKGFKMKAKK